MCIYISCPKSGQSQKDRIFELFQNISQWIYNEKLQELIKLYNGKIPEGYSLKNYIRWLNRFVEIWDYRKKQANGGERWNIKNVSFADRNAKLIMSTAETLGMVNESIPKELPNYILPLGGARLTNWSRPQMARRFIDEADLKNVTVVALSGNRALDEIEMPYIEKYAPRALTEFDAINKGVETAFGISEKYEEKRIENKNVFLQSIVRRYKENYQGCAIYSLLAPSSDSSRRANSLDTFRYFLNSFQISEGDRLLLVTSCIYVPYQMMKFMELAIENNLELDCVGVSSDLAGNLSMNPTNYLQEIKSTVNAVFLLSEKFL